MNRSIIKSTLSSWTLKQKLVCVLGLVCMLVITAYVLFRLTQYETWTTSPRLMVSEENGADLESLNCLVMDPSLVVKDVVWAFCVDATFTRLVRFDPRAGVWQASKWRMRGQSMVEGLAVRLNGDVAILWQQGNLREERYWWVAVANASGWVLPPVRFTYQCPEGSGRADRCFSNADAFLWSGDILQLIAFDYVAGMRKIDIAVDAMGKEAITDNIIAKNISITSVPQPELTTCSDTQHCATNIVRTCGVYLQSGEWRYKTLVDLSMQEDVNDYRVIVSDERGKIIESLKTDECYRRYELERSSLGIVGGFSPEITDSLMKHYWSQSREGEIDKLIPPGDGNHQFLDTRQYFYSEDGLQPIFHWSGDAIIDYFGELYLFNDGSSYSVFHKGRSKDKIVVIDNKNQTSESQYYSDDNPLSANRSMRSSRCWSYNMNQLIPRPEGGYWYLIGNGCYITLDKNLKRIDQLPLIDHLKTPGSYDGKVVVRRIIYMGYLLMVFPIALLIIWGLIKFIPRKSGKLSMSITIVLTLVGFLFIFNLYPFLY